MNREEILAVLVVVLGASGLYLMLPHKHGVAKPRTSHLVGAALGALALLLFGLLWAAPGNWISGVFFYVCAFAAIACGALTVTARDPIHSALWFAGVVLASSGLFLLAGASFLAAGTVIVYAGAIIVTFLFVIMLAQMEGKALYDRAARLPFRATLTCFTMFFALVWSLLQVEGRSLKEGKASSAVNTSAIVPGDQLSLFHPPGSAVTSVGEVVSRAVRPTARFVDEEGKPKPHVAGLGETLYTDHLVTVELAGALLFVALIAALAIAAPKPPIRPGDARANGNPATPHLN